MPFAIVNDMTGEWPLGEKACKIWIRLVRFKRAQLKGHFLTTKSFSEHVFWDGTQHTILMKLPLK